MRSEEEFPMYLDRLYFPLSRARIPVIVKNCRSYRRSPGSLMRPSCTLDLENHVIERTKCTAVAVSEQPGSKISCYFYEPLVIFTQNLSSRKIHPCDNIVFIYPEQE